MLKIEVSKRLITTTTLMALILVLIITLIISIINEKSNIQSELNLSQQNRKQLHKSESVTLSLLLVESRFREYCITFERPVFDSYKTEVNNLAENIRLMLETVSNNPANDAESISKILTEKTEEAEMYARLKLITDSLIFNIGNLEENQIEIEKYIVIRSDKKIDTLSVSETNETYKKGLLKKIKSAIVGEKVQQSVSTKVRVQSQAEEDILRPEWLSVMQGGKGKLNMSNISELGLKNNELKESELKLIEINNRFISEIRNLNDGIKIRFRNQEEEQNSSFVNSLHNSTNFLQYTLIFLMILACYLVGYSLFLAYKNNKFQEHITSLNKKIMKESIQKDKVFSIIGHDLMSPFNAILGFSDMLAEASRRGSAEDTVQYASIINQSTKRILNLLQNLLLWARVQNGNISYSPQLTQINKLVSDCMLITSSVAQHKDIILKWDVSAGLEARIDPNMINSVLQNLVTNAIKFTKQKGTVSLKSFIESDNLNFIISDSGVGMSEQQLDKLFKTENTSSTKGTDNEIGSGLGLIICKEFIELHHGNIWAESSLDKGTIFYISIPLLQ